MFETNLEQSIDQTNDIFTIKEDQTTLVVDTNNDSSIQEGIDLVKQGIPPAVNDCTGDLLEDAKSILGGTAGMSLQSKVNVANDAKTTTLFSDPGITNSLGIPELITDLALTGPLVDDIADCLSKFDVDLPTEAYETLGVGSETLKETIGVIGAVDAALQTAMLTGDTYALNQLVGGDPRAASIVANISDEHMNKINEVAIKAGNPDITNTLKNPPKIEVTGEVNPNFIINRPSNGTEITISEYQETSPITQQTPDITNTDIEEPELPSTNNSPLGTQSAQNSVVNDNPPITCNDIRKRGSLYQMNTDYLNDYYQLGCEQGITNETDLYNTSLTINNLNKQETVYTMILPITLPDENGNMVTTNLTVYYAGVDTDGDPIFAEHMQTFQDKNGKRATIYSGYIVNAVGEPIAYYNPNEANISYVDDGFDSSIPPIELHPDKIITFDNLPELQLTQEEVERVVSIVTTVNEGGGDVWSPL